MTPPLNLIGQRFGRLLVVARAIENTAEGHTRWVCRCDCEGQKEIRANDLKSGKTQSCGCLQTETTRARSTTHGKTPRGGRSKEYTAWANMVQRCTNPAATHYCYYGAKGVLISPRWLASFEHFLEDVGEKPSPKHSLDRIDVNGHYEPGNCRWVTHTVQMNNTRRNRFVQWHGKTWSLKEFAIAIKKGYQHVVSRLHDGWSPDRIAWYTKEDLRG